MLSFSRVFRTVAVTALILASVAPAAASQRRRASRIEVPAALKGKVTDAASGTGVSAAVVNIGESEVTADKEGNYRFQSVPAGATTVSVRHWGYVSRSLPLSSRSGNVLNVSLQPGPIVTLTRTDGTTFPLDFELLEFQSNVPLGSPGTLEPLTLCRADGSRFEVQKSEVKSFEGPGTAVSSHACCPQNVAVRMTLHLKSGGASEVFFPECDYYKVTLLGRDRRDGDWIIFQLKDIARLDYPN